MRKYNFDSKKRREFLNFIYEEAKVLGFDLEFKYFEYTAKKGRFIFLLDAFDEVASNNMDQAATEIEELATRYSNNPILVTSRKLLFNHINNTSLFHPYQTNGLSKDEAIALIKRISRLPESELREEVFERFIKSLEEQLYDEYQSFAENPILLFLMLQMFQRNANFPAEKATFIKNSYRLLYKEHDHSKLVAMKRQFKTDLSESTMLRVISYLCFLTYFENNGEKLEFTESEILSLLDRVLNHEDSSSTRAEDLLADLITRLCIIHKEGRSYYFVHNIFQEFYAANYLYELYDESQEQFFKTAFLAENMNERLILTTLEYYDELDKEFNKKKLNYNIFLPILEELKRRNEGRDFGELDTNLYDVSLSSKGEGDISFDDLGSYFLYYLMEFAEKVYLVEQDKKLPLPVKFPKIKEKKIFFIFSKYHDNLTDQEYFQLHVKIYNELQNVKLTSEAMELMEKYKLDLINFSIDYSTIRKDAAWYEVFKKSSAYECLNFIEDWVTKTRTEKEADKRKIPILNFKK